MDGHAAIIGNLLALLGEGLLVVSASSKGKGRTVAFQTAALASVAAANLVLGGYGGALVNMVGIGRNVLLLRGHDSLAMRVSTSAALVALALAIGAATGFADRLFWLPLAANLLYTMCGHLRGWRFKAMCATNFAMWLPYDLLLGNYVSAASDAANILLSARAAVSLRRTGDDGEAGSVDGEEGSAGGDGKP